MHAGACLLCCLIMFANYLMWQNLQCGESVTIEGKTYTISAVTHRYQLRKGKYEASEKRLDVLSTERYILNLHLENLLEQSWKYSPICDCCNLLYSTTGLYTRMGCRNRDTPIKQCSLSESLTTCWEQREQYLDHKSYSHTMDDRNIHSPSKSLANNDWTSQCTYYCIREPSTFSLSVRFGKKHLNWKVSSCISCVKAFWDQ